MTDADAECDRLHRELERVQARNLRLTGEVDTLSAERDTLAAFVTALCERVAVQAEMLGRAAEHRADSRQRIGELEAAIAPFAEILVTGWDGGTLPATVHYPVQLGHLRRLARVLAGIGRPASGERPAE